MYYLLIVYDRHCDSDATHPPPNFNAHPTLKPIHWLVDRTYITYLIPNVGIRPDVPDS